MSVETTPEPVTAFGDKRADKVYRRRPGAYAVAFDGPERVATVLSNGAYALPGGGIDFGETMAMALEREVLEETGLPVTWHAHLVTATQFHTVSGEGSLEKVCHYHLVRLADEPDPSVRPDHELVWMTTESALQKLAQEADRFAVELAVRVVSAASG